LTLPLPRATGAVGAWVVLVALEAALLWVTATLESDARGAGNGPFVVAIVVFVTVAGSVGLFLRSRRPGNAIGALLLLGPILIVAGFLAYATAFFRHQGAGADDVLGGLAGALASAVLIPGILLTFAGVAILFPDGRFLTRRWRIAGGIVVAIVGIGSLLSLFGADTSGTLPTNPIAIPGVGPDLLALGGSLGAVGLVAAMVLALASVSVRFRRAEGVERQQLKWFVAAVALNVILLPLSFLTDLGPADVIDLASVVAATLIPLAIGIAILRYRLYDIDTIINRAIVYGSLTAVLAGLMAGAVVLTRQLFESILGAGTDLTLIVSTVVAVSAFEPVKKRIQAFVDRRLKPGDDPAVALLQLEDQFRSFVGALDPERSMRQVLAVAMATQRAAAGRIHWQRGSSSPRVLALPDPQSAGDAGATPPAAPDGGAAAMTATARAGTDWATITLSGGSPAETARGALVSLLQTVLEELR
jgi:hypothetical protein